MEMNRKRYSLPQAGGTWYSPVREPAKRFAPSVKPKSEPETWKVTPIEPIKMIVPMSIDSVDEQDAELEAYLEPNPQELEVSAPLAHEECELLMDETSGESEELSGVVDGD
jgi:hypothetical protein